MIADKLTDVALDVQALGLDVICTYYSKNLEAPVIELQTRPTFDDLHAAKKLLYEKYGHFFVWLCGTRQERNLEYDIILDLKRRVYRPLYE